MELYFLKSAACLAVLLTFYKLLLEKENMHNIKRVYLLASVVAANGIPFITFTTYVEPSSAEIFNAMVVSSEGASEAGSVLDYLPSVLAGIYSIGVLFFSVKFFKNLRHLIIKIRNNTKIKKDSFTHVLLSKKTPPHTFFSFIFFNKDKYLNNQIPQDVKIHEEAHARQRHSLDVIFVELLQIIFWFNPLIYFLKNTIKLNHEFLADRAVIRQGVSTSGYQQILLSYSSGDLQSDLVNPVNYSSIKKRFTVMKTQTSKGKFWVRNVLLLPLLAGLIYGFSTKEVVEKSNNEKPSITAQNNDVLELRVNDEGNIFLNIKEISLAEIEELDMEKYSDLFIYASPNAPKAVLDALVQIGVHSTTVKTVKVLSNGKLPLDIDDVTPGRSPADSMQEKASPEMVAEYNKLANYYNSMPKESTLIKKKDYDRMKYIYSLMTSEQKKKAEKFPVPSPPPPPNSKMVDEYNKLAKQYGDKVITEEVIQEKDFQRMLYIHGIMSEAQRKSAVKLPPPPPPAPAPSPAKGEVPSRSLKPVEVKGYPNPSAPPPPPPTTANEELPAPVEVIGYPTPPPPPPPPSFEDLVEQGATFYYNGKVIEPEVARRLVEVEKKVNVQITEIDGKTEVRLTDKDH